MTTRAPELTPPQTPATPRVPTAWRWAMGALAVALLFYVYWRLSWSGAANSDSAAIAIQAREILHGNWLLRGWWMADVTFYTTEVPQYALLEAVGGFGVWVVHVAAAMSYTLIVVLAALLAKGRATGSEGWTRALLGGGIAASPQVSGALIMLLGPDHTGTVVPVLATWLVIDRAGPGGRPPGSPRDRGQPSPRTPLAPVIVCLLLTWIMVADQVVLLTAIGPLIAAAVVRAFRRHEGRRYELALAAAAAVAAGLGVVIPNLITRLGGYKVWHFQTHTMPLSKLPRDAWHTVEAVLELFGANVFEPHSPVEAVLVAIHLAGVLAAIAALGIAVARFFREDAILVPGLAVGIALEIGAFLVTIHSSNLASIREIVAVMPLGAVLAGRLLAAPLLRLARASLSRARTVAVAAVAAVVLAGYLGSMAYDAARASVPSANQELATWLAGHGLTGGLAAYWQAGSITLDTGGKVTVNSVVVTRQHKLGVYYWESDRAQYNPAMHSATFVVAGGPAVDVPMPGMERAAIRTFGPPAHTYRVGAYTVLVWQTNILRHL
ncbi:MAG TPA: hypothetical protein VFB06_31620 [Streptosporangiaceae bacterium]|nr:hypothetical protein [Streptosporangiaceae bacterium]